MKQPLLSLRPLSVSFLLSLAFVFHSVNSLDNSYDEDSDLDPNECGISDIEPKIDTRVVGGVEATPHSWPWQVSIRLRYDSWKHYCVGSLLNSRWVITTAHCLDDVSDPADCEIVLGKHNITKKERTEQKFIADKIIVHKGYKRKPSRNDIALIRLPEHARFNRYVKPICLPGDDDDDDGTPCVATGWGQTQFTGDENVLNQVYLPVISNKKCNQWYWPVSLVTDDMICAGYPTGGKSGCSGDSGGPLACLSDGIWKLFGVASWVRETCIEPKSPTVFTRVMNYVDWIRKKTEQYDY